MKRLVLLPVLLLGFSFACDQPYEEVYGIKIGCPASEVVDLDKYEVTDVHGLFDFYNKRIEGVFDYVYLGVADNTIIMADFISREGVSKEQVNEIVNKQIKEFGDPVNVSAKDGESTVMTFKGRGVIAESTISYLSTPSIFSEDNQDIYLIVVKHKTKKMLELDKKMLEIDKKMME